MGGVKLSRILAAATGAELSVLAGLAGLSGLFGAWSGRLDVINHAAPLVLVLGLLGGLLAWLALPKDASRRVVLALAVIGVLAPAAQMAPDFARALPGLIPPKPKGAPFTVLHFNVWNENFDPERTVDQIIASGADVVMMQEGSGPVSTQFKRLRAVYPYMSSCRPLWLCGQAVFSKRPITMEGSLRPRPPLQQDSLAVVWVRTTAPDGKPVTVATTHFSWPILVREQASQRDKLVRYVATLPKEGLILSGDLNSAPWSFGLRGLDARLRPLTRRTLALFSWPAVAARVRQPIPAPFMPIDHVYAAPEWRTLKLRRLPRSGSDHYAVLAVFSR
jgi:endonuclease/exonuclease/phosphatase (EEP) superfamily protein YafD